MEGEEASLPQILYMLPDTAALYSSVDRGQGADHKTADTWLYVVNIIIIVI